MKPVRFRERSWRFYRNWLIFTLMLVSFFVVIVQASRSFSPVYLVLALPAYFVGSSIFYAYRITHPRVRIALRQVTPGDAGLSYEKVEFPSRDGLTLFGWYVPGKNRAAVILVHGAGGSGISMIYHATALALYDYGVLMFDLRAHGSSDGDTCTSGWLETNDLLGALDYVRSREDVDGDKTGVLGISLGGQIALRTAAQSGAIRAVVAEGPSLATLADHGGRPTTLRRWINYPFNCFSYAVLSFMNGVKPPPGVLATIKDIAPRPILLISTGKGKEQHWTRGFYEAASEPKELWEIVEARHGGGYFAQPETYAQKVAAFFNTALLESGTAGNASR